MRKIYIKLLLGVLFVLGSVEVNAQVATGYTFTQSAGTFTAIAPSGTPAALFPTAWDDDIVTTQALGFTFNYNGTAYTTISISANGIVVFGSTFGACGSGCAMVSTSNNNGLYLGGTGQNNGIAGLNMDLGEQTYSTFTGTRTSGSATITGVSSFTNVRVGMRLTGTGISLGTVVSSFNVGASTITMSTTATSNSSAAITPRSGILVGTSGSGANLVFIVQWVGAKRFSSTSGAADNLDFQIRLNEANDVAINQSIDVVYGTVTTSNATSNVAQTGIRTTTSDFNSRTTASSWTATTASGTNTAGCTFSSSIFPPTGRTFTWTPALKPEPTNQPTSFAKGTLTTSNVPLTWVAAVTGAQAPDGYYIQASNIGTPSEPTDGTDVANQLSLAGGTANVKVTPQSAAAYSSFTNYTAGTMYYYKINSYTNTGSSINYKTASPVGPTINAATLPNVVTSPLLTATGFTTATISWTAATGYNNTNHSTLVFVKSGGTAITAGTATSAPSVYTASTVFSSPGTAYQLDASAFCVYNGDGTTVSLTGLTAATTYQVLILTVVDASNSDATNSSSAYVTTSGSTAKAEPENQPTGFAKGTLTTSNVPLTWAAAITGAQAPDGYYIQASNSATPAEPVDGTDVANQLSLTGGTANVKVTPQSATSYSSFTNHSPGTMYFYKINSYTNTGSLIDYKTASPVGPTFNAATLPNIVTASSITANSSTTATISWTAPTGYVAGTNSILVFVKAVSAVSAGTPTNAPSTYTASTIFSSPGTAYQNDGAAFCVYNGDGTSVTITGLNASTTYNVLIYTVVDASNSAGGNSYSAAVVPTAVTTPCPNSTLPFYEGFNVGASTSASPTCWSQQFVSGAINIYQMTASPVTGGSSPTPANFNGTGMAGYPSYNNSTQTRLVTPPLTTTGISSVDVNFEWNYYNNSAIYTTEGVTIQYSTNGTTWTTVGSQIRGYNATAGWAPITVTLPAGAANQATVYIGFLFQGNTGYDMYMDDVNVMASPPTYTWTGATNRNWDEPTNWSASTVPTASNSVIVPSGGNQPIVNVPSVCKDITLGSGSTIDINSTLNVSGSWTNNGCTISGSSTVTLSGLCVIGGTSSTTFPNLSIGSAASVVTTINTNVTGNFSNTGIFYISTNANSYTLAVTGNFSQSAGTFVCSGSANSSTLTVGGTFDLSGGAIGITNDATATGGTITVTGATTISGTGALFMEAIGSSGTSVFNANGDATFTSTATNMIDWGASPPTGNAFNIKGNFSKSGTGTFYTSSASTATGFVFNGTGTSVSPQTFSYSGTNSDYTSYVVNSGTYVKMLTALTLSASSSPSSSFTVNNGGTIDCSTLAPAFLGGASNGSFILSSGGTLATANTAGVVSSTSGSVSTSINTRSFNAAANYIFYGTANQNTSFATTTMNNLTIANTGAVSANTVTINTAAPTVNGTLAVTNGILDAGAFQIIGNTTNNFTLASGTTFRMSGATTADFPTLFTGAHCVFNAASTVEYYGATQTISATPTYGNLTITTAGSKTAAAGLTIAGNVLINSGVFAGSTFSHLVAGNWTNNASTGGFTSTGTVTFNKSGTQLINGSFSTTFNNVALTKASASDKVLASVNNTISASGGLTFPTTGGTWEQSAGTLTFTTGNVTVTSIGGLTLSGTGSFSIPSSLLMSGALLVNTGGTLTLGDGSNRLEILAGTAAFTAGTLNINGRLTLTAGSTSITGATINIDPQVTANLAASGDVFGAAGAANITFSSGTLTIIDPNANTGSGNAIQLVSGGTKDFTGSTIKLGDGVSTTSGSVDGFDVNTGGISLSNLIVNNPSGTNRFVRLVTNDMTVAGTLTMSAGNIDARTNSRTVYVSNNATSAIAYTAGMVDGNLKRAISTTGANYLWPVGFSTNYTPATYNFTDLTAGDLNVIAVSGDEPNLASSSIDATKSVNMYWTTTATGAASTNYDGNYAWPATLNDGGVTAGSFVYGKYNAGWTYPTVSGTPTTTTLAFTGASGFSNHAIGNCKGVTTSIPGANQTICSTTTSVTLAANAKSGSETGVWSISSGPSSNLSQFSSTTDPAATFTPDGGPGSYVLTWTLSIAAPCAASSSNDVTITVNSAATVNAGTAATICTGSAYTLTGASIGGGATTGTWTIVSATGTMTTASSQLSDITATATPASVTFTPIAGNKGTVTLRLTTNTPTVPCVAVSATVVLTVDGYTWTGDGNNTTWTDPANWPTCGVPASGADFTIATGAGKADPILTSDKTVGAITFATGTTLSIGSNILTVNGTITGAGTLTGSATSSLVIGGAAGNLNFTGGSQVLKNLTLNTGATATLNTPLDITAGASPGAVVVGSGATLTTGGNLTLKSDVDGTARVGTSLGTITGAVSVERYIPAKRAWRLVTAPVRNAGSIWSNWQNNGTASASYGVNIWGPTGTNPTPTGNGLNYGPGYSMKQYNAGSNNWSNYVLDTKAASSLSTNTGSNNGGAADNKSFLLFVTNPYDAAGTNITPPGSTITTLKATGALQQGDQTFALTANTYNLVGNPYASPVDFASVMSLAANQTAINDRFWLFDATATGPYGLGDYLLIYNASTPATPDYRKVPSPFTTDPLNDGIAGNYRHLQSGQAIFVEPTGAGTLTFKETYKSVPGAPAPVFIITQAPPQELAVNMYKNTDLMDGALMLYDNRFSTALIPSEDAKKVYNDGINMSIARNNTAYTVEARPEITAKDTSFLWIWNIQADQTYRFAFRAKHFNPLVSAWLEDAFTGARTAVSIAGDITEVSFSTTSDPASQNYARFRVVYQLSGPLPLNFTDVKAYQQGTAVKVDWTIGSEINADHYEVEYSTTGSSFAPLASVNATGNNNGTISYGYLHLTPITGINYYRIKAIDKSGVSKYSIIVKVTMGGKGNPGIVVYPNPVVGKDVALQLRDLPAGKYDVQLINSAGQVVSTQRITHGGGTASRSLTLPSIIGKGVYRVVVYSADKTRYTTTITITGQ